MTTWRGEIKDYLGRPITGPVIAVTGDAYKRVPNTDRNAVFARRLLVQLGDHIDYKNHDKTLNLTGDDGEPSLYFENDAAALTFLIESGFIPDQG